MQIALADYWRPDSRGGFRIGCLGWHSDTLTKREVYAQPAFLVRNIQPASTFRVRTDSIGISFRCQSLIQRIVTKLLKDSTPVHSSFRVEPQQTRCDFSNGTERPYHCTVQPKMLLPVLEPRVEKPNQVT